MKTKLILFFIATVALTSCLKRNLLPLKSSPVLKQSSAVVLDGQDSTQVPGIVIDHYSKTTGIYVGSPSICILPDGKYIASHDVFGSDATIIAHPYTKIFRSSNAGVTWDSIAQLQDMTWGKLFVFNNNLYMIGCSRGTTQPNNNMILMKSTDGGYTWSERDTLLNGTYNHAPTPVVVNNGRIWHASVDLNNGFNRAVMMNANKDSNITRATNWFTSNTVSFPNNGVVGAFEEANAVIGPNNEMRIVLRLDANDDNTNVVIKVSADGTTADRTNIQFPKFPGGGKKFCVLYDSVSNKYYSLSNYTMPQYRGTYNTERVRNTLTLESSTDLTDWKISAIALFHPDVDYHGFQYADFQFEGNDLIFVSRTAYDDSTGGAANQHNANFLTFHRIPNFRTPSTPSQWQYLLDDVEAIFK